MLRAAVSSPAAKPKARCADMETAKSAKTPRRVAPLAERFWAKVDIKGPDACWPWAAHRLKKGYGWMHAINGPRASNRIAAVVTGKLSDLDSPLHVLHTCDNPCCCNPAHLFIGTNSDNVADRVVKGRTVATPKYGCNNGMARFSESVVRAIRADYRGGVGSQSKLARMYGTTQSVISRIVSGKRWGHIL